MKILTVCFSLLYGIILNAQQEILSTQGELYFNSEVSISFTIGESNIAYLTNSEIQLSEGFHHTTGTYYPLSNECEEIDIFLNENNQSSGNYSAEVEIISSSILSSNSSVDYVAGQSILLKPGFHAPFNCEFLGILIDCTPSQSSITSAPPNNLPTLEVAVKKSTNSLNLSPNPARDLVELTFEIEESSPTQIFLFNATGTKVNYWDLGILPKGTQFKRLSNLSLSEGIYYLSLVSNHTTISKSLIILN